MSDREHCTLCGSLEDGYYDVATLAGGHGIAYRLCTRCHAQDTTRSRVGKLLERRYRGQGGHKA